MSVIAKVSIRNVASFGSGSLVELGCVCENDLMAAYAGSEEDKLFTKYSPWGEIKLHQPSNYSMGAQGDSFYVMLLSADEVSGEPNFVGSHAWGPARVVSLTDFGDNQAKRVEICNADCKAENAFGIDNFNWKMSVDNPPATGQFKPGSARYYVAFYPASKFDRNSAIAAAHGR